MERAPRLDRRTWLLLAVSAAFALRPSAASAPLLRLPDLDNRLVDPNPAESPEAIRGHLKDYRYPASAIRDPRQQLARFAAATITPEAAVYDRQGRRIYLGRVDDRYVALGVERPAPTRHDLEEALDAAPAVGCFIADFAQ